MSTAELEEVVRRLDYAELALKNGDPSTALDGVTDVLETSEAGLPVDLDLRARSLLASAREGTGDYPGAIAELDLLVSQVPRESPWVGLLISLNRCRRESGDVSGAIRHGHAALAEVQRAGLADTEEGVRLAVSVAGAHLYAGDPREALRMCERAAERAEAIGSDLGRASAYWTSSLCHEQLGHLVTAADHARAAISGFQAVPDPRSQGMIRTNLALLCSRLEPPDLDEAGRQVRMAATEFAWSQASVVEKAILGQVNARLAYLRGDLGEARRSAHESLRVVADKAPRVAAGCHLVLGQAALVEGDQEDAQAQFRRTLMLLTSCGMDGEVAQAWFELGGLLDAVGDTVAAIDAYRRAAVSTGLVRPRPAPVPT